MKPAYEPREHSLAAKVLDHFRRHGGALRTTEIAERFAVSAQNIHASLVGCVEHGLLVTCNVDVPGTTARAQVEYRLSAGGAPRAWNDFTVNTKPPRRRDTLHTIVPPAAAGAPLGRPNNAAARDGPAAAAPAPRNAAQAAPAAQDKAGVPAPENPVSAVAELSGSLSQLASSAADRAPSLPSPISGEGLGVRAGQGQGKRGPEPGAPWYSMDSEACLTIVAGDEHIVLAQPHAARLFAFMNRFGDVL